MPPLRFLTLLLALSMVASASNNILVIIADDYGIDSSSLYNTAPPAASLPPTPTIALLAQTGLRFTHAYASPVCSPTRASMLTGRHAFRTGVGTVVSPTSGDNQLKATEFTLPRAFAANGALGYSVAAFGKWHLATGALSPGSVGGWPYFEGSIPGALQSYTNWNKVITNGVTSSPTTITNYATTELVDNVRTWIQGRGTQPWFAWVAFNAGHTPIHTPPTNLHSYGPTPGTQRRQYEAMIEAMDTEIARLLLAVDRSKTDIIFLGDNGTIGSLIQSPFPTGRGKDTLYEGALRVPLIVNGPSVVSPGRTSDTPVQVMDLFSTILELAGINVAATVPAGTIIDARSLKPIIQNLSDTRTEWYAEEFDALAPTAGGRVLRDVRYKLIRNRNGTDEFYDLQTDPYESTNLFASGVSAMTAVQQSYYYRLRFDLGRYTTAATPSVTSSGLAAGSFSITAAQNAGTTQTLWRCTDLPGGFWVPAPGATSSVSGTNITFTDPAPPSGTAFYSVLAETP